MSHIINIIKRSLFENTKKKFVIYIYFILSLVISGQAFAKVCFLGDIDCIEESFDTWTECDKASLTQAHEKLKCFKYSARVACNDDQGNYYRVEGCAAGYENLDNKHYCLDKACINNSKAFQYNCCPQGKARCKDTSNGGKWHFCADNENGVGETCEDTETFAGHVKYQTCEPKCEGYPYTTKLSNANCTECSNSKGKHYQCTCNSGYILKNGNCESDCAGYPYTKELANANCTACPYNSTRFKCTCNSGYILKNGSCDKDCSGYPYTENTKLAANFNCTSCEDRSGTHYQCSCKSGYKLENGSCEKDCSGYPYTESTKLAANSNCTSCEDRSGTHYQCTCNSGYILKNGVCEDCEKLLKISKTCSVGDVFYSNGKCGNASNFSNGSCYTPIGVVYSITDGGQHGWVLALSNNGWSAVLAQSAGRTTDIRHKPTIGNWQLVYKVKETINATLKTLKALAPRSNATNRSISIDMIGDAYYCSASTLSDDCYDCSNQGGAWWTFNMATGEKSKLYSYMCYGAIIRADRDF